MTYKKSAERKQQILECAKRHFAQKGFEAAQIADICDELHIARGTVYQYFESKEDIFRTLIREYFESMSNLLTSRALDGSIAKAGAPPIDQLKALLIENTEVFFRHMYNDRDIGKIILYEGYTQMPDIGDMLKEFFEDRRQRVVNNLQVGMALGILRNADAELLASAMLGSGTRLVLDFIIEGKINSEEDLRRAAEELVNFQLHGVLSPAAGGE